MALRARVSRRFHDVCGCAGRTCGVRAYFLFLRPTPRRAINMEQHGNLLLCFTTHRHTRIFICKHARTRPACAFHVLYVIHSARPTKLRSMRPAAGAAGSMASMEWEPKALSLHELKYAREAALYVLRTHSSEDAVRIFTEGLKPVLGVRKDYSMADSDDEDELGDEDYDMFNPYAFLDDDSICCHQYGRTAEERDVATAPF